LNFWALDERADPRRKQALMAQILPRNATFRDLTGPLARREEYLRCVVQNLDGHGAHREAITVRMGIAGRGISPHYKFETPVEFRVINQNDAVAAFPEAFIIYHGASYKPLTAFELRDVRDEHWSSEAMTYDDVRAIFGQVRTERRSA
jgi:hypothetical protein